MDGSDAQGTPVAQVLGPDRPWRIGLTGGIAAGKSLVAQLMAGHGAVIIDTDLLARAVVEPGTPGLQAVVERFGPGVLAAGGSLDRAALGRLVFADAAARADLEAIVHPLVAAAEWEADRAQPDGAVVVHAIPLLVETGQTDGRFDQVVVVDVPPAVQVERLRARDGLTLAEARQRIAAQASRAERLAAADVVIDNAGTPAQTAAQVDRWWAGLAAGA